MDYNAEELMRKDFARVVELDTQIRAGAGPEIGHNVEYGREMAARERAGMVSAWLRGEHIKRWTLLSGAHKAFEVVPAEMVKLYGDVESGRDTHGLDAVDRRSIRQAAEMHGSDRPELRDALIETTRQRRRGPIERSR
jgi:hypothetical protein